MLYLGPDFAPRSQHPLDIYQFGCDFWLGLCGCPFDEIPAFFKHQGYCFSSRFMTCGGGNPGQVGSETGQPNWQGVTQKTLALPLFVDHFSFLDDISFVRFI
jgi:hypothetical protein